MELVETDDGWRSVELDDNGDPLVRFTDVKSANSDGLPPYYVEIDRGADGKTVHDKWFLEQDRMVAHPTAT